MPLPKPSQLRYFEPAQLNHKWRILLNYYNKNITVEEAAAQLNTTTTAIRQMSTIYGRKILTITPIVDMLVSPLGDGSGPDRTERSLGYTPKRHATSNSPHSTACKPDNSTPSITS